MSEVSDTIVWVTGGSGGLGAALIETVPFSDCRIINVSRRPAQGAENHLADLSDPASWFELRDHLVREFDRFSGRRAIFIHNAALTSVGSGFAGRADRDAQRQHVLLNAAAPMVIGEAFLAACPEGLDAGLVLLGSAAAGRIVLGRATYSASKAAVEQWVRIVRQERRYRGSGPWVVAIRPGIVDTPGLRASIDDGALVPERVEEFRRHYENGTPGPPASVAQAIWAALPPDDEGPDVLEVGVRAPSIYSPEISAS